MDTFDSVFSTLILLSSFLLMANKRIKAYIATLQLQAMLIAAATCVVGIKNIAEGGGIDLFAVSLIIVAIKVVYIPRMLKKTWASVENKVEKDFFLNIPALIMICCGIVVLTDFTVDAIDGLMKNLKLLLINSISVVLIGLFFTISRKKAIGQIIGLLVIENGLFITALFATNGLPFIVDMGIFVDLVTSVLILGTMVFQINDRFESIDTDKLSKLKG